MVRDVVRKPNIYCEFNDGRMRMKRLVQSILICLLFYITVTAAFYKNVTSKKKYLTKEEMQTIIDENLKKYERKKSKYIELLETEKPGRNLKRKEQVLKIPVLINLQKKYNYTIGDDDEDCNITVY
ncbi:hypothetical protein O3M35_003377 [Rhynocoris fuscipes]|uniref:Uncharacterized protein n=1 Tax=Rhynocoris fuscipes TaxID=488301 RepID=A0AAW1CMU7_9HEMI